jgi:DNA-binding transcriptional LysR family regulator
MAWTASSGAASFAGPSNADQIETPTISRPLRDSTLVRHHLADWPLVLCASPAYLAERGHPRVASNNQFSIRQLTLRGLGLSFHAEPEIAEELAAGRLVRVLPDWTRETLSVDVLMPARKRQPAKVRMALHALRGYLARTGRPRRKRAPAQMR